MADAAATKEFHQRLGRLEGLLAEVENFPDADAREMTREIVQALLEFHGEGLERLVQCLSDEQGGEERVKQLAGDDLVSSLLMLHGLHPLDFEARVRQALEKVRPYLASHGGNVELLGISDDGAVRLRLEGSCHGCPSSQATLKGAIEEAIYSAAPEVTLLEVEGVVEAEPVAPSIAGFVPLASVGIPDRPALSRAV